jgi:hypothetical protein
LLLSPLLPQPPPNNMPTTMLATWVPDALYTCWPQGERTAAPQRVRRSSGTRALSQARCTTASNAAHTVPHSAPTGAADNAAQLIDAPSEKGCHHTPCGTSQAMIAPVRRVLQPRMTAATTTHAVHTGSGHSTALGQGGGPCVPTATGSRLLCRQTCLDAAQLVCGPRSRCGWQCQSPPLLTSPERALRRCPGSTAVTDDDTAWDTAFAGFGIRHRPSNTSGPTSGDTYCCQPARQHDSAIWYPTIPMTCSGCH